MLFLAFADIFCPTKRENGNREFHEKVDALVSGHFLLEVHTGLVLRIGVCYSLGVRVCA